MSDFFQLLFFETVVLEIVDEIINLLKKKRRVGAETVCAAEGALKNSDPRVGVLVGTRIDCDSGVGRLTINGGGDRSIVVVYDANVEKRDLFVFLGFVSEFKALVDLR